MTHAGQRLRWPEPGPHFQARQLGRHFYCGGEGYWCHPALVRETRDRVYWLHIGLGIEWMNARAILFRPYALAVTPSHSTVLVRYENFRLGSDPLDGERWDTSMAEWPPPHLCEWTREQYREADALLMCMYTETAESFAVNGTVPAAFRERYRTLTHPLFHRYLARWAAEFHRAVTDA
ncbi:MAG TPA: hypothetical protein PKE12_02865 [Kiritimatiellia bacterium]|nr:hypothetical protein [Kiritimatiellia bacterium]